MIFAIRRPDNLKGVFTTPETINNAKKSVKGVSGASFREFNDNELSMAHSWANVKGSSDVKQVAVTKINSNKTETDIFLDMIDKYKKLGYTYLEIIFKNRNRLGISLKGAVLGELRKISYYSNGDNLKDNVEYSLKNKYIKSIYPETTIEYNHPVLFLNKAYELKPQQRDVKITHNQIDYISNVSLNMNLECIVEINAFKSYQWIDDYYSRSNIHEFKKEAFDLYEQIKDYI